jgi:hypothetical protein
MRKSVWAGTALVVLGAVAVYLISEHAAHHPESWLGRCTLAVAEAGSQCNPFNTVHVAVANGRSEENCPARPTPEVTCVLPPVAAVLADEAIEPIKIEPQPAVDLPPEDEMPSTVPASEETPEPRFAPGEESEPPAGVAAPAHDEEDRPYEEMPYAENEEPVCKKCGSCPKDCCQKGTCPKDCAPGKCSGTVNSDAGLVGSICSNPCGGEGCCLQCCVQWLLSLLGLSDGEKCYCGSAAGAPANAGAAEDKPEIHEVPNCQEDPSYSHQYPSCPYTGSRCPCYPSTSPSSPKPEVNPLDELLPPTKKVKKPASSSRLDSPQSHQLGIGLVSALRSVAPPAEEGYETHPDVDTMEARPSDIGKDMGQNDPF